MKKTLLALLLIASNALAGSPVIFSGSNAKFLTSANQARGVVTTSPTGVVGTNTLTNGQLMIGSTGLDPVVGSLTAGSNIAISTGAGAITINASGMPLLVTSSVSTTGSVSASTDYVDADATSFGFTLTMPSANLAKKQYVIKKTDSGFNQVTVSYDSTSTILVTPGDALTLTSNGSSYAVTGHSWNSGWNSFNMIITATTTSPTLGSAIVNQARWQRFGANSVRIYYNFLSSSAGTTGSGTYLYKIPNSWNADTSQITPLYGQGRALVGNASRATSAVGPFQGMARLYDPTNIAFDFDQSGGGMAGWSSSSSGEYSATGMVFTFDAIIPISGWPSQ